MKKGLGSIPKSLSWINSEESTAKEAIKPVKKIKEVKAAKEIKEVIEEKKEVVKETPKVAASATKSTQKGLPYGWTRATFIVNQELNDKLKALAYWERLTVKEVLHEALTQFMADKKVKALPKR